ncbi:uncharacterized protein CTRU02_214251 [Colletotrichum truncatum]|uniref:Uncharacterized protein n=1 Tax=Colletotrichum truncatum TaxID=5467 RepID=A0ACC3YI08_COLTU|nr:uncharacterized protein CTRU02_11324 [Colletotrichum truncatum]KAF6786066.1 hypothetical protein CTRU02_11324 [Colletotrichum truncatum]
MYLLLAVQLVDTDQNIGPRTVRTVHLLSTGTSASRRCMYLLVRSKGYIKCAEPSRVASMTLSSCRTVPGVLHGRTFADRRTLGLIYSMHVALHASHRSRV